MCEGVSHRLLVKNIDEHQRKEAHDEAQEDHQHHHGQSEIVFVAEELQLVLGGRGGVELVELCMLLANSVEDARVRKDDDEAWQQEPNEEDERLWRFSVLLQNGA